MTALRAADAETLATERRMVQDFEMPPEPWTVLVAAHPPDEIDELLTVTNRRLRSEIPRKTGVTIGLLDLVPIQPIPDQFEVLAELRRLRAMPPPNVQPLELATDLEALLTSSGVTPAEVLKSGVRLSGALWVAHHSRNPQEGEKGDRVASGSLGGGRAPPLDVPLGGQERGTLAWRDFIVNRHDPLRPLCRATNPRMHVQREVYGYPPGILSETNAAAALFPQFVPLHEDWRKEASRSRLEFYAGSGCYYELPLSWRWTSASGPALFDLTPWLSTRPHPALPESEAAENPRSAWNCRCIVFPSRPLSSWSDRRAFRDAVAKALEGAPPGVALTGPQAVALELTDTVGRDIAKASIVAALAVLVLAWLTFRSLADTALALTPMLLGLLWAGAILLAMGQSFHAMNLPMIPLILGMGVDDGIHLTHRWRAQGRPRDRESLRGIVSSTGRAIVLTSVTTIAGFGSLMFAEHRGLASMGLAVSVGMFTCLVASLFVWPAVAAVMRCESSRAVVNPEGA